MQGLSILQVSLKVLVAELQQSRLICPGHQAHREARRHEE